jgi:ABC-2 type transport system ATP-binding protein
LVGENGAGKTTTLRIAMGILKPTRGRATIFGEEMMKAPRDHRARVGYVSQEQRLYKGMTLREITEFYRGLYPRWDQPYADRLMEKFALPPDRLTGDLSGGEQRKAAILLSLAARTDLLIMDEPAAGLDPIARRALIDELIGALADGDGRTVVFSTHILSDLERIATHVGFLHRGRMVAEGPLEDLQQRYRRVQVIFPDTVPAGFQLPGALRQEGEGPVVRGVVRMVSETQLDGIRQQHHARVDTFPLGLEDLFIELVGRQEVNA